jgi:hypothetical protein
VPQKRLPTDEGLGFGIHQGSRTAAKGYGWHYSVAKIATIGQKI